MKVNEQPGKIDPETFQHTIWKKVGRHRQEVIAGPQYGVDVSVIRLPGGGFMASASDPASLVPGLTLADSAWLTVHLTANDLATTGHLPMYAQFVLNLPAEMSTPDFETYWTKVHEYCDDLGVAITGGHTGKVRGQASTFVGGVTMSLVAPEILLSKNIRPGQCIIVTKGCAWSASAILAKVFPETVKMLLGVPEWEKVGASFQGLSVAKEAVAAFQTRQVSAMHDATEGGVLGAVHEMCLAGGVGALVNTSVLPVSQAVSRIAGYFGFDPHCSLGSGALLMACNPDAADTIIDTLGALEIPAFKIGHFTNRLQGVALYETDPEHHRIFHPDQYDGYWKAYSAALSRGWK